MLIVSIFTLMVCDSADAQVNEKTLESVASPTGISEGVAEIKTGVFPVHITGERETGKNSDVLYVANSGSNSVSVVNTTNNTVIKDIRVIDPGYMYYDRINGVIYVANSGCCHVSVINATSNSFMTIIPVGEAPSYIDGDFNGNVYIANSGSDTVTEYRRNPSVINVNIPVGKSPSSIFASVGTGTVFIANSGSDTVTVVRHTYGRYVNPFDHTSAHNVTTIPVGESPSYIDGGTRNVYVANSGSDTISVINTTSDRLVTTIPVGESPRYIFGDFNLPDSKIYVANFGSPLKNESGTISVIDSHTNKLIRTIPAGGGPVYIYGNLEMSPLIYVANVHSNTISVINTTSDRLVTTIPVGESPRYIFGDPDLPDSIYVANSGSYGISVINTKTNRVLTGITFYKSPFEAGRIICDSDNGELEPPMNRFIYVSSGTQCIAEPSKGFEFSSWTEISSDNLTRTVTTASGSPWNSVLDTFNLKLTDPAATFTVNKFGNFTAYFRVLPDPLPPEYWASLFTVVATALVGSLLIPAIIGWTKSRRQTSRLKSFHKQMALAYEDRRLDEKDLPVLNPLYKNISDFYAAGKINNEQYTSLKNEVSTAFQEIFKNRIGSVPDQDLEALNNIRNDMIDAYNKGKLSNDQYTNLKDEVSIGYEEIFKKKIENREADLQEDISDAYSKGKITKLHYDLLNEKISKMTQEKE